MAKSFYEGLYGFDKDMKMIPVLAESYDGRARTGSSTRSSSKKGIKFHDGTDFKADAVKANLDRVTNPDNKLKRYGLYNNNIAKTEVVDDYTARITLKTPFSPFIAQLAHPSTVMISPTALSQVGQQGHRVPSGRHRSVQVRRMEADRLPEGREVRRLLEEGLSEGRHDHLEAGRRQQFARGADADRRGALHVPGCPTSRPEVLKGEAGSRRRRCALDRAALSVDEHAAEALRQPEGAAGDRLRDQQGSAGEGRVQRLRDAADGVAPQGVEYAVKIGPWPYDVAKAKQLLTEAGYPNGFETELWSGVQPQHRAEGDAVPAAAAPADRHQDEDHAARSGAARREGRELAGSGDRAGAPLLRRLVDVDG